MRTCLCVAIALISAGIWTAPIAQSKHSTITAEFPGASLKWVRIAEPEFQKRGLDLDHYIVYVGEYDKTVIVSLASPDADPNARGSSGTYPGYEVEISKSEKKILSSHYVR